MAAQQQLRFKYVASFHVELWDRNNNRNLTNAGPQLGSPIVTHVLRMCRMYSERGHFDKVTNMCHAMSSGSWQLRRRVVWQNGLHYMTGPHEYERSTLADVHVQCQVRRYHRMQGRWVADARLSQVEQERRLAAMLTSRDLEQEEARRKWNQLYVLGRD